MSPPFISDARLRPSGALRANGWVDHNSIPQRRSEVTRCRPIGAGMEISGAKQARSPCAHHNEKMPARYEVLICRDRISRDEAIPPICHVASLTAAPTSGGSIRSVAHSPRCRSLLTPAATPPKVAVRGQKGLIRAVTVSRLTGSMSPT